MKAVFIILSLAASVMALGQNPGGDVIETSKGPLQIQPITHGTLVLTWGETTIYVDPYGGAKLFEGVDDPDLILITNIHGDHLNSETLEGLNTTNAEFIVPRAVYDQLPGKFKERAHVLNNDESISRNQIGIKAIPMYNLPVTADSRHPQGRGNGYVLSFGNKNIYLSGDTSGIPEMRTLKNIDVAFVCMNLPYTMDVDEAAEAVLDFKPKVVYPYHYRGQNGLSDVTRFKQLVNGKDKKIEVRLRDWYAAKP